MKVEVEMVILEMLLCGDGDANGNGDEDTRGTNNTGYGRPSWHHWTPTPSCFRQLTLQEGPEAAGPAGGRPRLRPLRQLPAPLPEQRR